MGDCQPQIQAVRIRVARLGLDGVPLPGVNNLYVSASFTKMSVKPDVEKGEKITVKNAGGETCVNYEDAPNLLGADIELEICSPDPYLTEMLTPGSSVLTVGTAKGWAAPSLGKLTAYGVSIELWAKRVTDDGDLDPTYPYARWAYPRIKNLQPSDHSHENAAITPKFIGRAVENANWYNGPANDWTAASDRYMQWIPVTAGSLPTATCGYQNLAAS